MLEMVSVLTYKKFLNSSSKDEDRWHRLVFSYMVPDLHVFGLVFISNLLIHFMYSLNTEWS